MRDATAKAIEAWSKSSTPLPAFDKTRLYDSHDFDSDLELTVPAFDSVPPWLFGADELDDSGILERRGD